MHTCIFLKTNPAKNIQSRAKDLNIFLEFFCVDAPPGASVVGKVYGIEMEFEGKWDLYLVNFGIHFLYKVQSDFVSATIRIFGNNSEVQTYPYVARPVGKVTVPLSETMKF